MAAVVRGMMKEQHKAMFAALRTGDMDPLLENVCGPLEPAKSKSAEPASDPDCQERLSRRRASSWAPRSAQLPYRRPSRPTCPRQWPRGARAAQPAPVADAQAVIDSMKSLRDSDESAALHAPALQPQPAQAHPLGRAAAAGGLRSRRHLPRQESTQSRRTPRPLHPCGRRARATRRRANLARPSRLVRPRARLRRWSARLAPTRARRRSAARKLGWPPRLKPTPAPSSATAPSASNRWTK